MKANGIASQEELAETAGMDERAAAKYLGTSVKFLRGRRWLKEPPRYHKIGSLVRYRLCDLKAFQEASAVETPAGRQRNPARVA